MTAGDAVPAASGPARDPILELAAAEWSLGALLPDDLPAVARAAIDRGHESQVMIDLAAMPERTEPQTLAKMFRAALAAAAVEVPERDAAIVLVVGEIARNVELGTIAPMAGAAQIAGALAVAEHGARGIETSIAIVVRAMAKCIAEGRFEPVAGATAIEELWWRAGYPPLPGLESLLHVVDAPEGYRSGAAEIRAAALRATSGSPIASTTPARSDPRMPPAPPKRDEAKLAPALYAFYASCAVVSLGAAIAASCWITFGDRPIARRIAWVGVAMIVLGIAGAFVFLNRARTHETKQGKPS